MKKLLSLLLIVLILSGCTVLDKDQQATSNNPVDQEFVVLSQSLNSPWSLKELPDGSILITEKEGQLKRFVWDEGLHSIEFDHDLINFSGQGGLLDVFVAPDFKMNQTLYLTYSTNHTVLAKAVLSQDLSQL